MRLRSVTGILATLVAPLTSLFCAARVSSAQTVTLLSPQSHVRLAVSANPLRFSLGFDGQPVLLDSLLGLEFRDQPRLTTLRLKAHHRATIDRTWTPVWGKSSNIRDRYTEQTIDLRETAAPHRLLQLQLRAYDDGAALRYLIPAQPGLKNFVLTRELTGFRPPQGTILWASTYKNFHQPYESEYPRQALADIPADALLGLPTLLQTGPSTWAALSEADLTDWAGMYLSRAGDTLSATLAPRRDGNGLVQSATPRHSPWRLLMLAHTPAALMESNLVENLSEPIHLTDISWIAPGLMAWDHWWSGDVEMTTAANKRFIDFAALMHFPYQLIDWQWYGPYNKPTANITQPAPQLDLPALRSYAAAHNVRLWLWLHSGDVDRALAAGTPDNAFGTYQQWGIAGVKIDFMESDDQQRVNWYETVVRLAAQHHLMVDFHGAYKPTGLRVTYPNLLTREAVLGNEYNKFGRRVTPTHKATLPFTRGLVGPMDYTPGGFLNRSPEDFTPQVPTEVMGSRANELALFVLYWSPLTCVTDDPAHYLVNRTPEPGLGFLRDLPTVWDETRALEGAVGEHIIVARRKGTDWWLGGITADSPYASTLSLGFLGPGRFTAHIFRDPLSPQAPYTALDETTQSVTAADIFPIQMRPAGGLAIRFQRLAP